MKKNIFKLSALALAGTMALFSCGRTETVDPSGDVKSVKVSLTDSDNKGTPSITVNPTDGKLKVEFTVNYAGGDVDKIFMIKSTDGSLPEKVTLYTSSYELVKDDVTGTNEHKLGKSINAYTIKIDDKANTGGKTVAKFTVEVPVTSTVTQKEVYQIWATNGDGSFKNPSKNSVLGVVTLTVNYSATAPAGNVSSFSAIVGNATSNSPSYLSTKGVGGTLFGSKNNLPTFTDENGVVKADSAYYALSADGAPIVDLVASSLDAAGTALGTSSAAFISPSKREEFANPKTGKFSVLTNVTKYVKSTLDFATVGATEIKTVSFAAASEVIKIEVGDVIAFKTNDNRVGLIKVKTITGNLAGADNQFALDVKVTY